MTPTEPSATRGDSTRDALIQAALVVFGRDGFDAATTRSIADAAGANQALIAYHFGGKDKLYIAMFEHIAEQLRERISPLASAIESEAAKSEPADGSARRDWCLDRLGRVTDAFVALMTEDRTEAWARIIIREQQAPTAAFAVLYDGFMGRMLKLLTLLVQGADAKASDAQARIEVLTIVGQVLVFRAARAAVLKHTGWSRIGPQQLAAIQARIRRNVAALTAAEEE